MGAWLPLAAALRILWEVVAFRVRKLEMANLAGAVAIMVALRLPPLDIAWRTLFCALLNALVYLNNDYHDVALDARAPDKDQGKVRFMQAHMRQAASLQWLLFLALAALAVSHSRGLLLVLIAGGGICIAYSARLKRMPLVDVATMAAWGFVMPLSGAPLDRAVGLCLALQLGLFSSVFETIQVIRDADTDRKLGVRTTAVALGEARTLWLGRALMLICAGYAALVLHPVAGGVCLLALALRMKPGSADRFWTAVKIIYGIAWLTTCGFVLASGRSQGLLFELEADSTIAALRGLR
jgi:4-hydroxybenzoate polyprenyltransferase